MESITLYYREGSSDKVYQASLESLDGGYVVNFAYGRRGSTLSTGTKTSSPVPLEKAQAIYRKLVQDKTAKGYSPGLAGTPYQLTSKEDAATGILPQLLNSINLTETVNFITNPLWVLQEKFDGRRMMLRKEERSIDGINRNGLIAALPQPIVKAASLLPGEFILDGECVGDQLIVFDLLEHNGTDLRKASYRERLNHLISIVPPTSVHLRMAETAFETAHKAHLFEQLRREKKEGAVVKNLLSVYTAGRPASGGDALKCKFVETASFVVAKLNAKRSVALQLLEGSIWKAVGNVTVPPNQDLPALGDVIECRYLYAHKQSGAIFQPVYLGIRDDIASTECTTSQLKYKADESLRAAA